MLEITVATELVSKEYNCRFAVEVEVCQTTCKVCEIMAGWRYSSKNGVKGQNGELFYCLRTLRIS